MKKCPQCGYEDERKRFEKPIPKDVEIYALSIDFKLDGNHFVDYYESRGWFVGKVKMSDWKAAVRNWKRMQKKENPRAEYEAELKRRTEANDRIRAKMAS